MTLGKLIPIEFISVSVRRIFSNVLILSILLNARFSALRSANFIFHGRFGQKFGDSPSYAKNRWNQT